MDDLGVWVSRILEPNIRRLVDVQIAAARRPLERQIVELERELQAARHELRERELQDHVV